MDMARELYEAGKATSIESGFAKVFSDPNNAKLAARAHRRPVAGRTPFPAV